MKRLTDAQISQGERFLERQLVVLARNVFKKKYPEQKYRSLFPVDTSGDLGIAGEEEFIHSISGDADIVGCASNDFPEADVALESAGVTPNFAVGASISWTWLELIRAAKAGVNLRQEKFDAMFRKMEERHNRIAFHGDDRYDLHGFLNHPYVMRDNAIAGTTLPGADTTWATKTPNEILFDMNDLLSEVEDSSCGILEANEVWLPTKLRAYLASTPRSDGSDHTILSWLANASPYISSTNQIKGVKELKGAGVDIPGSNVMAVVAKTPDVLVYRRTEELINLPPNRENIRWKVPYLSGTMGLQIKQPAGVRIREGI